MGILLVVILGIIVVLSIIGISQRYLTSAVTGQTFRTSIGDLALDLAESVAEETLYQFRLKANDPASPLFGKIREDVYADKTGEFDASTWIERKEVPRILKDPALQKFYVKEVSARVLYQRQFEDLPYERFGLLKVTVRVQYDLTPLEAISREVEVGTGFKIVLIAPPRPFDQATTLFYVRSPGSELQYGETNAKKKDYLKLLKDLLDAAEKKSTDPQVAEPAKSEFAELKTRFRPAPDWEKDLPDLPTEPAAVFVVKPDRAPFKFDDLFVFKRIDDRDRAEVLPATREAERASAAAQANPTNVQLQRDMAAALRALGMVLSLQFKTLLDYRNAVTTWVGTDFEVLDRFRYKLRPEHWRAKAFYNIKEMPKKTLEGQLRELLAMVKPINGVLLFDNNTQVLDLSNMQFRGKLIIVVGRAGVKLSNVNVDERAQDMLTVVSVGGPMTVEGKVHAALVSSEGSGVSVRPGAQITGLLVSDHLPGPGDRSFEIVRLDKYYSGVTRSDDASGQFVDYYYVGTSPRTVYRKVSRK